MVGSFRKKSQNIPVPRALVAFFTINIFIQEVDDFPQ